MHRIQAYQMPFPLHHTARSFNNYLLTEYIELYRNYPPLQTPPPNTHISMCVSFVGLYSDTAMLFKLQGRTTAVDAINEGEGREEEGRIAFKGTNIQGGGFSE